MGLWLFPTTCYMWLHHDVSCGWKNVIMKLKFKILMCRPTLSGHANHDLMSSSAGCTRGLCIINTIGNTLTVQHLWLSLIQMLNAENLVKDRYGEPEMGEWMGADKNSSRRRWKLQQDEHDFQHMSPTHYPSWPSPRSHWSATRPRNQHTTFRPENAAEHQTSSPLTNTSQTGQEHRSDLCSLCSSGWTAPAGQLPQIQTSISRIAPRTW
jgi:hypothetical protein